MYMQVLCVFMVYVCNCHVCDCGHTHATACMWKLRTVLGVVGHLLPYLRQIPCPSLLWKPGWPMNFWGFFRSLPLSLCRILGLREMPTAAPGRLSHRFRDPSSGCQACPTDMSPTHSPVASVTTTFFEIITLQPLSL